MLLAGTPVSPTHRRLLDNIFTTKDALETAVQAYDANPTAAIATYGLIADWDVSGITDMGSLFYGLTDFNADISNWDTSGVTDMSNMFEVRSAPCLVPNLQSSPRPARYLRRRPRSAGPPPRPAPYAFLSALGSPRGRSTSR